MGITRSTLIWIGIGASIAILILLGIWVLFLRGEQSLLNETILGRGFGGDVPAFEGETGSTNALLREGIFDRVGFSQTENGSGDATEDGQGDAATSPQPLTFETPRLWQLSGVPSAGITTVGASSTLRMRFVERPSGNVFDANPYTGLVTRVTNTLIPQVYTAHFPDEEHVVLRHLSDTAQSATFIASITQSTSTETDSAVGALVGEYADEQVVSLAAHDGTIFSIARSGARAFGTLTNTGTDAPGTRIFTSAAAHWRSSWLDNETLLLVQNAASGVDGSALLLQDDGTTVPLLQGVAGVTAVVNASQNALLYSESAGNETVLYAKNDITAPPQALSLVTFAEKCVFDPTDPLVAYCAVPQQIPDATLPDAWYRGEVHFSDVWWRVAVSDGSVEFVLSPESEYGVALDVLDPRMNAAGTHILFLDARTRTPWALRIAE